jgi:excisionase family DNA binding protein
LNRFDGTELPAATEWLRLGEACRLLGVSPGTLRRWSDAGRIATFTTPGGHRRYRRSSLEQMLPPEPSRGLQVSGVVSRDRLTRVYRAEARSAVRGLTWMADLDDEQRLFFRENGRRLAQELLAHLDAPDRETGRRHLSEASEIAGSYGRMASTMGATLGEALETFLQFRRPFLDELGSAVRKRGIDAGTADEVTRAADRAMDALLVTAMAAHSVQAVDSPGASQSRRPGNGTRANSGDAKPPS